MSFLEIYVLKKNSFLLIVFILFLAFQAQAQTIPEEQIQAAASPIIDNILEAYNAGDYKRMTQDFSPAFLNAMSPEKLMTLVMEDYKPNYGSYISKYFNNVRYKDPWINVKYEAIFVKSSNVSIIVVFRKGDTKYKVEGLFLEPSTEILSEQSNSVFGKRIAPTLDNFFDALKSKDFTKAVKGFSEGMQKQMPAEKFEELFNNEIEPILGDFVSFTKLNIEQEGVFTSVYYIATHSTKRKSELKITFLKSDPGNLIYGLWYEPMSEELSAEETKAFLEKAGPIVVNYMESVKINDYKQATRDFSGKMFEVFGPETLGNCKESEYSPNLGKLVSWEFDRAARLNESEILYYTVTFSNGKTLSYKFSFKKGDDKSKIMGLWLISHGEN